MKHSQSLAKYSLMVKKQRQTAKHQVEFKRIWIFFLPHNINYYMVSQISRYSAILPALPLESTRTFSREGILGMTELHNVNNNP